MLLDMISPLYNRVSLKNPGFGELWAKHRAANRMSGVLTEFCFSYAECISIPGVFELPSFIYKMRELI